MSESDYQARIALEGNRLPGVRLWRQNVGTVRTADQRFFRAGPPKGATDLFGLVSPGGWAVFIECKVAGRKRTPEQIAYAKLVTDMGAIYLHADEKTHSVEQLIELLRSEIALRRGENEIEAPFLRKASPECLKFMEACRTVRAGGEADIDGAFRDYIKSIPLDELGLKKEHGTGFIVRARALR